MCQIKQNLLHSRRNTFKNLYFCQALDQREKDVYVDFLYTLDKKENAKKQRRIQNFDLEFGGWFGKSSDVELFLRNQIFRN